MPSTDQAELSLKWCFNFIEALTSAGVKHAFISPGSRSTPLIYALAHHPGIECQPVLDERSAAFMALGSGKSTGVPAIFACTSGTAVANALPAVIEARLSGTPLIVLSADRPPSARAIGSPQTIDQQKLFGSYPVFFFDTGEPVDGPADFHRMNRLGVQACQEAVLKKGPVHINLPFRKPLEPEQKHIEQCLSVNKDKHQKKRNGGLSSDSLPVVLESPPRTLPESIIELIRSSERPLVIAGPNLFGVVPRNRRVAGKPFKFLSDKSSDSKETKLDHSFSGWCQRCDIPVLAESGGFPGSILLHPLIFRKFFSIPVAPAVRINAPVAASAEPSDPAPAEAVPEKKEHKELNQAIRDAKISNEPVKTATPSRPDSKSEAPEPAAPSDPSPPASSSDTSVSECAVSNSESHSLMPKTLGHIRPSTSVSPLTRLQACSEQRSEKSAADDKFPQAPKEETPDPAPARRIPDTSVSPLKQLIDQVAKQKKAEAEKTQQEAKSEPPAASYPKEPQSPSLPASSGKPDIRTQTAETGKKETTPEQRFKIPSSEGLEKTDTSKVPAAASSPPAPPSGDSSFKPPVSGLKEEEKDWEMSEIEPPDLIIRIGGEPIHSETLTVLNEWKHIPQIIFDQQTDFSDATLSASHRIPHPVSEFNWNFDVLSDEEKEEAKRKEEEEKALEQKSKTVDDSAFNLKWWTSSKKKEALSGKHSKKKTPPKKKVLAYTPYKDQWHTQVRKLEVDQVRALNLEKRLTDAHVFFELLPLISDLYDVQVYLSNSLIIRDYPLYGPKGTVRSLPVLVNRGASGIDGVTSSAIGASLASGKPTVLFTGDLAFLHDSNALNNLKKRNPLLKIVVLNNRGGSIFRMLPFKEHDQVFHDFIETPQDVDISLLAKTHGLFYRRAEKIDHLPLYWEELRSEQVGILECMIDLPASMGMRMK
ncbi:thiamine pyrophosphate-binding protein [Balneolaceae bacterium ANBcel3]|nr:thiamine pyrophosphate-binding protein [Balneolaceae bacterium ANBcel3]